MSIDSEEDRLGLERVGRVVALALRAMSEQARAGMTTAELDAIGEAILTQHGARSAPKHEYGFPGINCISLNDEAVHGIPGARVIRDGDLVKIDVTAEMDGYVADSATSVAIAPVPAMARRIQVCAEAAFQRAMTVARAGRPISSIGRAIEAEVRRHGFAVLPALHSHGVGRKIHEEPLVPNYFDRRARAPLTEGLVITIEPIISAGTWRVVDDPDGWTIRTADGSLSAHYEHTVVITRDRPIVLTAA